MLMLVILAWRDYWFPKFSPLERNPSRYYRQQWVGTLSNGLRVVVTKVDGYVEDGQPRPWEVETYMRKGEWRDDGKIYMGSLNLSYYATAGEVRVLIKHKRKTLVA